MSYLQFAQFNEDVQPHFLLNPEIFTVEKEVGRGGFGTIYKVIDPSGQSYALKVLTEANPQLLANEIRVIANISKSPACNAALVCYYDAFVLNWQGKLVYGILTEFIEGVDLYACMKERQIAFQQGQVMTIAVWLASVLVSLHQAGYVHLDIKPSNIMIQPDGNLKLVDFGLSCFIGANYQQYPVIACHGRPGGTPGYMAPELASGKVMDNPELYLKTADIFAAGVTFYYLLSKQYPYQVDQRPGVFAGLLPPYVCLNTGYPCLDQLIASMVQLNPDARPTAQNVYRFITQCYNDNIDIVATPTCQAPQIVSPELSPSPSPEAETTPWTSEEMSVRPAIDNPLSQQPMIVGYH